MLDHYLEKKKKEKAKGAERKKDSYHLARGWKIERKEKTGREKELEMVDSDRRRPREWREKKEMTDWIGDMTSTLRPTVSAQVQWDEHAPTFIQKKQEKKRGI